MNTSEYNTLLSRDLAGLGAGEDLSRPCLSPLAGQKMRRFGGFIGTSPAMQRVYAMIESAARSRARVFITGDSGTGKEICAEAIHRLSPHASRPFVQINCAAAGPEILEKALLEDAAEGTAFLDEISGMNIDLQARFLHLLQSRGPEREGARIICATNRDPLAEVREGRLREDLYYRLHVVPIAMPPLRERGADILDIAQTALRDIAREEGKGFKGFSEEAEARLARYPWPGNIRELQNVIRHIVVMHEGTLVILAMLPERIAGQGAGEALPYAPGLTPHPAALRPLWQTEREAIARAIAACGGNIPRAAAALEISPSTIYRKKMEWERLRTAKGGSGQT